MAAERGTRRRVLFVTNDFPTRVGGIETFVLELCRRLPAADVVVYTASMPGDREYDARLRFPVYRDPSRLLLPTPAVARRIVTVMGRHGCDRVVFGASVPLGLLAPAVRRAGARRVVALTHGHEAWWARLPLTRRALRAVGDSVDATTYVSEWVARRIAPALSPAARSGLVRLSPGVDPDQFHPGCGGVRIRRRYGLAADAPVVVCLARLVKRKGHDLLIRAWPSVLERHPGAVLLVVGDGPRRPRLERLGRGLGVAGSVVFTGSVPREEVPGYVDAGDVFALPSRTQRFGLAVEAWGIVFLEAQACGLPVLIGDSGGAPETLAGPRHGRVVPASVPEVARGLVELLDEHGGRPPEARSPVAPWTWAAASQRLSGLLDW